MTKWDPFWGTQVCIGDKYFLKKIGNLFFKFKNTFLSGFGRARLVFFKESFRPFFRTFSFVIQNIIVRISENYRLIFRTLLFEFQNIIVRFLEHYRLYFRTLSFVFQNTIVRTSEYYRSFFRTLTFVVQNIIVSFLELYCLFSEHDRLSRLYF